MWEDGVYLGVKAKSGELIVGDKKGVWKTRTIQRKPMEERWMPEAAEMVVGVPWRTNDEDPEADGEELEVIKLPDDVVRREREVLEETVPRRFKIG